MPISPQQDAQLDPALALARTFIDLVPVTYLLAKQRYPFLPARTVPLDVFWAESSGLARAVFLLDYIARLYAQTPVHAALLAPLQALPTAVLRTLDHPQAGGVPAAAGADAREYSMFFDTDAGVRIDLRMGHRCFVALASVMREFHVTGGPA